MKLSDASDLFIDASCKLKGLSAHTIRAYKQDLFQFRNLLGNREIRDVSEDDLQSYVSALQLRGLSPWSIKRKIAVVRVFFAWLERKEGLRSNPLSKFDSSMKMPRRLPRDVPQEELKTLIASIRAPLSSDQCRHDEYLRYLFVVLLVTTGMRVSELTALTDERVDTRHRRIQVIGKGNRERYVFLTDEELIVRIEEYRHQRASQPGVSAFLVTRWGKPVSTQYVRRCIADSVETAGIKMRITPHMLRHSAASLLLGAGVDIRFVQKLLGHQSITTTQIYTHVKDNQLQEVIGKADIGGLLIDN